MVPEMARKSGLPKGFGDEEIKPPFTAGEVYGRIHEVGVTIEKIAGANLDVSKPLVENMSFPRTIWTFQGMGAIRLRDFETFPPEVEESLELLKKKFADEEKRW